MRRYIKLVIEECSSLPLLSIYKNIWFREFFIVQRYFISVKEVILKMNRHYRGIHSSTKHFSDHPCRHFLSVIANFDLTVGTYIVSLLELDAVTLAVRTARLLHVSVTPSSLLFFSSLPYIMNRYQITLFFRAVKPLLSLHLGLHVRNIDIVIDVSLVITHSGLVAGEAPFPIDDEFILMNTSFEGLRVHEFVRTFLLHRDSL